MAQQSFIAFQVAITGAAQQLAANQVFKAVTLTAKSTNVASIEITAVSNASATTGYILEKGQSITIYIANTNQIFVFGTAADILSVVGA